MIFYTMAAAIEEEDVDSFVKGKTAVLKYKGNRNGIRIYDETTNLSLKPRYMFNYDLGGRTEKEFQEGLVRGYLLVKNLEAVYQVDFTYSRDLETKEFKRTDFSKITNVNGAEILEKNASSSGDATYEVKFPFGTSEVKLGIENNAFSLYIDTDLDSSGRETLEEKLWGGKMTEDTLGVMIDILRKEFNYNIIKHLMKIQPNLEYTIRSRAN